MSSKSTVKHRSCDQCRTRKLACSKDPEGCERCKKENIICHYSEQKPMGRPRKRQFIETTQLENGSDDQNQSHIEPVTLQLYENNPNFHNDRETAEPYFTDISKESTFDLPLDEAQGTALESNKGVWHFGDSEVLTGPAIDFGEILVNASEDHALNSAPPLPTSTTSSGANHSRPQPVSDGPCSCLASMYLALSSLQSLPSDIALSLKAVRGAAATAAYCIWCPKCGSVVLDNPNPPIEAFQNTMLLGTILPIIANGYSRLLKMVDQETDAAILAGETKTFRFHDYGGLCGDQNSVEQMMVCMEKEMFFNAVEMPPEQWRATVRALLRVDIYGHEQAGFKRKGLKDLVAEMETRQKTRHHMIDAQMASGELSYGDLGQRLCLGEQTHGCLQILKMAKVAIDNLIIA